MSTPQPSTMAITRHRPMPSTLHWITSKWVAQTARMVVALFARLWVTAPGPV